MDLVPVFLCPRCAYRESGSERNVRHQPRGCSRCGFGFSFELLDDYYASPKTALIVCDQERRILVAGHAAFAVTGFQEEDLIGHEVAERLGLGRFPNGDPAATSLEWGVRVLNVDCTYRPNGASREVPATADFFPAYDDDGGLLVALTPK
jgi:PAS domain-containing protein